MEQKLARSVSIIGTSTLPQRYFDDPMYEGLSIYELWACACHQAMEDAGVKPRDIDKVVYRIIEFTISHMFNPKNVLVLFLLCNYFVYAVIQLIYCEKTVLISNQITLLINTKDGVK